MKKNNNVSKKKKNPFLDRQKIDVKKKFGQWNKMQ